MDMDDDDDFYAPDEPVVSQPAADAQANTSASTSGSAPVRAQDADLESGEEEEDEGAAAMDEDNDDSDSDSDIDIITERKDGSQPEPPAQARYSDIRNIPQRTASSDPSAKTTTAPVKEQLSTRKTSQSHPAVSTSKVDVHAVPTYKPAGKPITQVNIDTDLPDNDKPWRKPGTDISDYFNYGFDEFTWTMYAAKQDSVRGEFSQDAVAQNNKKMMEDMQMMMMGGMPGMPGGPGGAPPMPGMDGMPPEMQQMMQQMMAGGMDPSQMDPSAMFATMQNGGGNAQAGQAGQGQGFGGGGQGFGGNQGQGYDGFNQGMGRGAGGGFGGRGRRGRGGW
ncbi:Fip1 motif-domain-containing protein [Microdochium trichocladiopsis]|uniref:Fip1 motif-domain-containing protein n=1 Tax=Microdochium trichocladiopsis TaxID=1682393 RepID=A0A9P8YCC8_9PEZI|nr:Fip1 motif-domain-containing protein [Microdochium trichocladiopsis]KAH7035781.1 Fip1 motif-domain-containing protein [Microdochium trichocladiopsis]